MVMGKKMKVERAWVCLIYIISFVCAVGALVALIVCGLVIVDEYRITREY